MGGESRTFPPHIKDHKKCQLGRWARPIRLHKFSPNQPSFLLRFFDHLTTFYLETGKNRLLQREKLNPRECIKKPWIRKLHVYGVYLLDTLYNWSESDFREFQISVSHNIGHWWPLERKNLKIQQKKLKNHTKNSRYEKKLKEVLRFFFISWVFFVDSWVFFSTIMVFRNKYRSTITSELVWTSGSKFPAARLPDKQFWRSWVFFSYLEFFIVDSWVFLVKKIDLKKKSPSGGRLIRTSLVELGRSSLSLR